jgi:hypothetical protein
MSSWVTGVTSVLLKKTRWNEAGARKGRVAVEDSAARQDQWIPDDAEASSTQRRIFVWFIVVVGINVLGILWMALRAESPSSIREVLDILMQAALGLAIALLAFRTLTYFPYRTTDLFVMVLLLSVAMKVTLSVAARFSNIGLIHAGFASSEHIGELVQTCLISASVLIGGGAIGLRTCQKLSIERPLQRAVVLVSAMLSLPAAAGSVVFGLLLVVEVLKPGADLRSAPLIAALWLLSIGISVVNLSYLGKMLTLRAVISAQERLAGKEQ